MKRDRREPQPPPLALPHERDENTESPGVVRKVIKQAARDIDKGLVDTDNYTRATTITARATRRRRAPRAG
jgi:hypothetical protein